MGAGNEVQSVSQLVAWLLTLSLGFVLASCTTPTVSADELRQKIDRETPIGSDYSAVVALLDSMRISHSGYRKVKEFDLDKDDYVERQSIGAQIPQVERRLFRTYGIYLSFYFDDGGRLIEYKVQRRQSDP